MHIEAVQKIVKGQKTTKHKKKTVRGRKMSLKLWNKKKNIILLKRDTSSRKCKIFY